MPEKTWNTMMGFTAPCWHCFDELPRRLQQAVLVMGTDAECYDEGMKESGLACTSGNQVSAVRPLGVHCVTSQGVYNTTCVPWQNLSGAQRGAAKACAYTRQVWNSNWENPCARCFSDLSRTLQRAVLAMGTDPVCWDEQWLVAGMNCSAARSEWRELANLTFVTKFQLPHNRRRPSGPSGVSLLDLAPFETLAFLAMALALHAILGACGSRPARQPPLLASEELADVPLE